VATYPDLADTRELEQRLITTWNNSLPLLCRRPAPRSFSYLSCSLPDKLNLQLIDRLGTGSSIGDVPCTVSVLCTLSHILPMSLVRIAQRPVQLVDLEPASLIVPIRNDERELEWRYVLIYHSSFITLTSCRPDRHC